MRSSRYVIGFTIVVGVAMLLAPPASAIQYQGTTQFTCTTFTAAGTGAAILDRDNTGTGEETFRIDVRDGTGALIYTATFTNVLGTYGPGLISTTAYTSPPVANPITMIVTSLAGNGLPPLVGVMQTGTCDQLETIAVPTLGPPGLLVLAGLLAASAIWLLARR